MPHTFKARLYHDEGGKSVSSIVLSDDIKQPKELTLDKLRQIIGRLHGYKDYIFCSDNGLVSEGSEPNLKLSDILESDGITFVIITTEKRSLATVRKKLAQRQAARAKAKAAEATAKRKKQDAVLKAGLASAKQALADLSKNLSVEPTALLDKDADAGLVPADLDKVALVRQGFAGAATGSYRELPIDILENILRSLRLPRTTRKLYDNTFVTVPFIARLVRYKETKQDQDDWLEELDRGEKATIAALKKAVEQAWKATEAAQAAVQRQATIAEQAVAAAKAANEARSTKDQEVSDSMQAVRAAEALAKKALDAARDAKDKADAAAIAAGGVVTPPASVAQATLNAQAAGVAGTANAGAQSARDLAAAAAQAAVAAQEQATKAADAAKNAQIVQTAAMQAAQTARSQAALAVESAQGAQNALDTRIAQAEKAMELALRARVALEKIIKEPTGDDDEALLARQYVVSLNEMETSVRYFSQAWEAKAFSSGFYNIAASVSASYSSLGGLSSVSGGASFAQAGQSASSTTAVSNQIHLVGLHEVRKLKVYIPREMIVLDDITKERFKTAVDKGSAAIKQALEHYGLFIITEYTIGGKVFTTEERSFTGAVTETASKFKQEFSAALDVKRKDLAVSGGGGFGRGSDEKLSQRNTQQSSTFHLQAKGGNAASRENPGEWVASLSPENWEIISYDRLIPIYEFLSGDVRAAVEKAANEVAAVERKLWTVNNYRSGFDISAATRVISPSAKERSFKDVQTFVDQHWVPVPPGRYFKGLQLYRKAKANTNGPGNRLAVRLYVTDENFNLDERAESTDWGESRGWDGDYSADLSHKDGGWYFDVTPLRIPYGMKITAVRLAVPAKLSNRVGLQIKVANPDGSGEVNLYNKDNNQNYIKDDTFEVRPTYEAAVLSAKANVVSVRLAQLGSELGIEILTMPVPT